MSQVDTESLVAITRCATRPFTSAALRACAAPTPAIEILARTLAMGSTALSPLDENELTAGTLIDDRYRILRRIGGGGMGTVYQAQHVILEKVVALKVQSRRLASVRGQGERFVREARAAALVQHESIVDVTDIGRTPDGLSYFVMEYLRGRTLGEVLREDGPLAPARARLIALQVCRALDSTHEQGIVHRDLKPDNILLVDHGTRHDFVKILDFGVAQLPSEPREAQVPLTQVGMLLGTPDYMAPEQILGTEVDHRVDIYALGCVLYEMLTGSPPFAAPLLLDVLRHHLFLDAASLVQRDPSTRVPESLSALTLRALAKDPDARFQTMAEMATAIVDSGVAAPRPARAAWLEPDAELAQRIELIRTECVRGEHPCARREVERLLASHGALALRVGVHRKALEVVYARLCGGLYQLVSQRRVPELIDEPTARLLAHVEGAVRVEALIRASGMTRLDALRRIERLLHSGVLARG